MSELRTPVTVITGFLGSGKTTLLNRVLRSPSMSDVAVVINEFGSVGLDHLLTEASNDQIVILENGCLCCTVFGDLIATLNRLYRARESGEISPFSRIIVETSGLADPRPVVQAFLSDPTLQGLFWLESLVTVFDAVNGPGTLQRHDEAIHQLALADHVLITKLDLVDAHRRSQQLQDFSRRIRCINTAAGIFDSNDPRVDVIDLLSRGSGSLLRDADGVLAWLGVDNDQVQSCQHHHRYIDGVQSERSLESGHPRPAAAEPDGGIVSFCLTREAPTTLQGLELLLGAVERNLGPALLRLKGLVHVAERPSQPAVIQGAQHLLHNLAWLDRWPTEDRSTRLVFITTGIARAELEEMVELLDRVANRTAIARERAQQALAEAT